MITITAEFLGGAVRANSSDPLTGAREHDYSEWPPSPSRLFSALVAGGGTQANNRILSDDSELDLLESAQPPLIAADEPKYAPSVQVNERYVPVDERKNNRVQNYLMRQAQIVRPGFRCAPRCSTVTYVWPELVASQSQLLALRKRAARVGYLGCADSPVRLMVNAITERDGRTMWRPSKDHTRLSSTVLGVPYQGFREELDRHFDRFMKGMAPRGASIRRVKMLYSPDSEQEITIDGEERTVIWLGFDKRFGARRALAVGEALRGAVLSNYQALFGEPPAVLHGHGTQNGETHAQFIGLPNIGYRWSKGEIHGAAVVLPAGLDEQIATQCVIAASRVNKLALSGGKATKVHLRREYEPRPWATNPKRWTTPATEFATAFPAVYERYVKKSADAREVIGQWCQHAGLPRPVEAIFLDAPAFVGQPKFGSQDVWRERSTKRYPFKHVALRFAQPVAGPIAIGRGRTFGLGLLVPLIGENSDSLEDSRRQETEGGEIL